MRWVYRVQQRVAITRSECNVILGLALLFGIGLAARYVQRQPAPLPAPAYAEAVRPFEQAMPGPAAAPAPKYASKPAPPAAPINLNTATAEQLQRLPRIGPKMAARILAYREAHGAFRRVEDLVHVRGIGKKTLARLAPLLCVEEE